MPFGIDGFTQNQEREKVSVFQFASIKRNLIDIKHRWKSFYQILNYFRMSAI